MTFVPRYVDFFEVAFVKGLVCFVPIFLANPDHALLER